jgi:hypothetical protein
MVWKIKNRKLWGADPVEVTCLTEERPTELREGEPGPGETRTQAAGAKQHFLCTGGLPGTQPALGTGVKSGSKTR